LDRAGLAGHGVEQIDIASIETVERESVFSLDLQFIRGLHNTLFPDWILKCGVMASFNLRNDSQRFADTGQVKTDYPESNQDKTRQREKDD
jgi:hypothetical protein